MQDAEKEKEEEGMKEEEGEEVEMEEKKAEDEQQTHCYSLQLWPRPPLLQPCPDRK